MGRRHPTLFPGTHRPRRRSRKLMYAVDTRHAGGPIARFECKRCGHDSGWLSCTHQEQRRGVPCPHCNAKGKRR